MKPSSRTEYGRLRRSSVSTSYCFMKLSEIYLNRVLKKHEREDRKQVSCFHWSNKWKLKRRKIINLSMIQVCSLIIHRSIRPWGKWSFSSNMKISFCKRIRQDQKIDEVYKKYAECPVVSPNHISSLTVCNIKLAEKSTTASIKITIKTMMVITLSNWWLMRRKMTTMEILQLIVIRGWILNTLKRAQKVKDPINHLESELKNDISDNSLRNRKW